MNKNRVVLDTNVLFSALNSTTGNSAIIFDMFLENKLELIYSDSILREYREILNRYSSRIDALKAEKALKAIEFLGVLCSPHKREFVTPDIDDHIFYDAAMFGYAHLITWNLKHYPKESFILSPDEFLKLHC